MATAAMMPDSANPPPPPPPPQPPSTDVKPRRRAREVSSRYMTSSSPISSSSPRGECHHPLASSPSPSLRFPCPPASLPNPKKLPSSSKPMLRRNPDPFASDSESEFPPSSRYADENQQPPSSARRSLETPLLTADAGVLPSKPVIVTTQHKKRAVARLFSDNGSGDHQQPPVNPKMMNVATTIDPKRRPRPPGTPMIFTADRTSSTPAPRSTMSLGQNLLRSVCVGSAAAAGVGARKTNPRPPTPARVNLFPCEEDIDKNGMDDALSDNSSSIVEFSDSSDTCSIVSHGGLCDSPPLPGTSRVRSVTDLRSSMPEADHLPTMSAKRMVEEGSRRQDEEDPSCRASTSSLCYRSLNSALSNCQQPPFYLSKSVNRPFISSKPPQPPNAKAGVVELKKVKKGSNRQEDIHMLRLLDNCYVQWRFINAKARAAGEARRILAEKSLYGIQGKLSELQSSVSQKRLELEQLKRKESLFSILEAQMPHLDEWTILEEDYSSSLSGATKALQDASLRLPIIGNVKADIKELKEVLNSSVVIMESLNPCIERFLTKAEGIEDVASDLAMVITTERAMVEQCGNLLSEAHMLQVKECSLRSQLIQLKKSSIK